MTQAAIRLVADSRTVLGESPLWRDGVLWWTDPIEKRLFRLDSGRITAAPTDQALWSLAMLPDGTIAGTLDAGFCTISEDGAISPGPAAALPPGCRFNDMAADPAGGLWAGSMHRGMLATSGTLFHTPAAIALPRRVAGGLGMPNGMKFSADGSTLYLIDTLTHALLAFPVAAGRAGEPAIVSDFMGLAGKPDGMTIAPDGTFWVAMWGGSVIVQLAPDGAFLRAVELPVPHVSSLCAAGADRLFVTTSCLRLSPDALARHPGSGGLFEVIL